jgi:hypothetical protein
MRRLTLCNNDFQNEGCVAILDIVNDSVGLLGSFLNHTSD